MTTPAKAYTLLRDKEQRKKADIIRKAKKFATLAGYYRYRDEQDFQALVAARHPLVVEAYPELFAPEPDEAPELETEENPETGKEGPEPPHSSPLPTPKMSHEEPQNITREEVPQ